MKVILAPRAIDDLQTIGDWIARDDPVRALTFVEELFDAAQALSEMPSRFPLVVGLPGVRRRVFGKYLIFYRVHANNIDVARILHGARDYDSVLALEPSDD